MEKEYNLPEENNGNNAEEPTLEYRTETEMLFSPPLTEEELAEGITGDELRRYMHKFIDELFDKNENSVHPKH